MRYKLVYGLLLVPVETPLRQVPMESCGPVAVPLFLLLLDEVSHITRYWNNYHIMFNYNMTKKVLIIGLNYGIEPSIALYGRINIAVNARGVFIAEYGILEENITYLTDEWAPLTKDQILAAIQALVDESTSLEEIYIYYAGYGSGIRIFKQIKYPEVEVPETVLLDPYNPFIFH